jgi:hypothetical protein
MMIPGHCTGEQGQPCSRGSMAAVVDVKAVAAVAATAAVAAVPP